MDLAAFVQVVVRLRGGGTRRGTGYRLRPDRVLTAGHVVAGREAVELRFDVTGGEVRVVPAEVLWEVNEDGGLDAAILACAPPADLPAAMALLADGPLAESAEWESRGWPGAALPGKCVAECWAALSGKAYAAAAHADRWELTVEAWPAEVKGWQGISGAPVFVARRLSGVIVEGPESFEGRRLHASPIHRLLARNGFREHAGLERGDRWQGLEAEIRRLLEGEKEAAEAVAAEHDPWRQALGKGVDELVAAICRRSEVAQVLEAMHEAHRTLIDRGRRPAARAISEVLARVVPLLFERQLVHTLPAGAGAVELRVPLATATLAELALAAVDTRGYRYEPVATQDTFPQPALSVASFPEPGFDVTGARAFHSFLDHLGKSFAVQEDRDRLYRLPDAERYPRLAKLVNGELAWRAKGRGGERRYFLYDSRFARDHGAFLDLVRQFLGALRLVELQNEGVEDLNAERELCRPLRDLLYREYHHPL